MQKNPLYTENDYTEYTLNMVVDIKKVKTSTLFCNRTVMGKGLAIHCIQGSQLIRCDNGSAQWSENYELPINQKVNINIVKNATEIALYVDGQLVKISNIVGDKTSLHEGASTIGASSKVTDATTGALSSWNNYLNGEVYLVNIYDKALTEQEVKNNYEATKNSGYIHPNPPEVKEGMIPVYYDNGWKKADQSSNSWYDYRTNKKQWANVVTVKQNGTNTREYYQTSKQGTPIAEEDILAMFVWIPRYAYKITSGYHTAANGTGDIKIKFLDGISDEYEEGTALRQVDTNALTNGGNYVVHPAFTEEKNGKEITGFWVGKFESSNASTPINNEGITESSSENLKKGLGDGVTKDVTIRPNVTSWRNIDVPTMFDVCQAMNDSGNIHGLTSDTETMMMKNSQWGAVAYLTQSAYGNKQIASDANSGIWSNPYTEGYIYENANNSSGYGMENYATTLTGMVGSKRDDKTAYYSKVQTNGKTDNGSSITIKYNNVNTVETDSDNDGTPDRRTKWNIRIRFYENILQIQYK